MTEGVKAKFVAAWSACQNPELDSENPHFRNRYASLKATLATVREACGAHGLAYVQRLGYAMTEEGYSFDRYELFSFVTDGEGTMDLSRFPVECPPNPQSFGSNLTYAKRQQAQADWGITGDPDDDGEAAAQSSRHEASRRAGSAGSTQAPDKKKWLTRCLQLKAQCMAQGVKESGLDSWYRASFGDVQPGDLTIDQVTEWGKYLAQIAKDSDHGKEKTDEHQQSDD